MKRVILIVCEENRAGFVELHDKTEKGFKDNLDVLNVFVESINRDKQLPINIGNKVNEVLSKPPIV